MKLTCGNDQSVGTRCLNSGIATGAAVKKPTNVVLLNKAAVLTMCEGDSVIYVTFISLIVQFNAPST